MFKTLTAFALAATLATTPAVACKMVGKNMLFMDLIRIGERSYHEPVPLAMPNFSYQDAKGQQKTLADHAGKALIVTFWHPKCIGCKVDLPRLNSLLEDYPEFDADQFVQISIENLDEGPRPQLTTPATVDKFLASKSYGEIDRNFDTGNEMFQASCLVATPSHLMINSEGKVTDVLFGPLKWAEKPFIDIARNFLANY